MASKERNSVKIKRKRNRNLEGSSTSATTSTLPQNTSNGAGGKPKKRLGTIDWGRPYVERMSAHIAIKLSLNSDVQDFELVNNLDKLGAFNDIVVRVKYRDESREDELLLLQLKHKLNQEIENVSKIFEVKGQLFYLEKYQYGFDKICAIFESDSLPLFHNLNRENVKFILFSNAKFVGNQIPTDNFVLNEGNFPSTIMEMINTQENARPYKISHKGQSSTISTEFLSHLWVVPNQIHAQKMEDLVKEDLENNIQPEKIKIILDSFAKWTRIEYNERITKLDMVHLLHENCYSPFINESLLKILKHSILKRVEEYFNIELNGRSRYSRIDYEMVYNKNELNLVTKREMFTTSNRYNDLFYLMWQLKKLPMLIKFTKKNSKCVQFFIEKFEEYLKAKSFVLIYQESPPKIDHLNKINNFNILSDVSLSLQGKKPTNLQVLINNDEEVLKTVTPNVLLTLLIDTKTIGEEPELVPHYIGRKITLPILKESVFEETDHLFVLNEEENVNVEEYVKEYDNNTNDKFKYENINRLHSNLSPEASLQLLNEIEKPKHFLIKEYDFYYLIKSSGSINDLRDHLVKENTLLDKSVLRESNNLFIVDQYEISKIGIENYITEYKEKNKTETNTNVLFSYKSAETSLELLKEIEGKSKHFLTKDGEYFKLIKSNGSINDLGKYFVNNIVKEEDVLQFAKTPISIINNTAGMGKTSLLHNLANNASPEEWTIYLNLNKHVTKLDSFDYSTQDEEIVEYLINDETKDDCVKEFMKALLLSRAKNERLILFLDGYDEIMFRKIKEFTEWALKKSVKIVITTRPSKIIELENSLGIFSSKMQHLDEDDQTNFLKQFYKEEGLIQKVIELNSKHLDNSFIGIPLQTRLLVEVLKDVPDAELENVNLDLITLYEKFLDKNIQKEYKIFCKKLSLTLFFTEETLEELHFDLDELHERIDGFKEDGRKDFVISGFTNEDVPMFVHRTYAEFLTAQYLFEQLKKKQCESLREKLLHLEMTDVRYFLDGIAAKNCELHKAVLNNKLDLVQTLLNKRNEKDELGRTALELASSYGRRFDLDTKDDIKGLVNLEKHVEIQFGEWVDDYHWRKWVGNEISVPLLEQKIIIDVQILRILLNCDNSRVISSDYTINTGSLEMLERFPNIQINESFSRNIEILLYYCCVYNFVNIFNNVSFSYKSLNTFYNTNLLTHIAASNGCYEVCNALYKRGAKTIDNEGNGILHAAVKNNQLNFIHKILNNKDFNEVIEETNYEGETALHAAIEKNSTEIVNLLRKRGANTNIKTKKGLNILQFACLSNGVGIKMVESLLQHDVYSINDQDENGWTALHYAVNQNKLDVVNLLISNKADLNLKTNEGQNVIQLACPSKYGIDIKMIECLLQHDVNSVNYQDENGWTALHHAVKLNKLDVVKLLISNKADLNIKTNSRQNALQLACVSNVTNTEMVEYLIQQDEFNINSINDQDEDGWTALHHAVKLNKLDVVKLLISNKADLNIRTKKGQHVFQLAFTLENDINIKMLECLLQHDQFYINDKDEIGYTALHWTVFKNRLDVVNLLISNKANPNIKTEKGQHVLLLACGVDIKMVERLLQYEEIDGSAINDQDNDGWTALHYAVYRNKLDIVNLLISNKADPNIKTRKGQHVLQLACGVDIKMVERLLQHDEININSLHDPDDDGWTGLFYAVERHNLDVVNFLHEKEANFKTLDVDGNSLLHIAVQKNDVNEDLIYIIEEILTIEAKLKFVRNNSGETPLQIVEQNKLLDTDYYINWDDDKIDLYDDLVEILS